MPDLSNFPEEFRRPPKDFHPSMWTTTKGFIDEVFKRDLREELSKLRAAGKLKLRLSDDYIVDAIAHYRENIPKERLKHKTLEAELQQQPEKRLDEARIREEMAKTQKVIGDLDNSVSEYPASLVKLPKVSRSTIHKAIEDRESRKITGAFWWNGGWWIHRDHIASFRPERIPQDERRNEP